jgi:hypothetical protein
MGGCTKKPRRARLESLPCLLIVSDNAKPGVVTRSESGLGDLGTESVWLEESWRTGSGRAICEGVGLVSSDMRYITRISCG